MSTNDTKIGETDSPAEPDRFVPCFASRETEFLAFLVHFSSVLLFADVLARVATSSSALLLPVATASPNQHVLTSELIGSEPKEQKAEPVKGTLREAFNDVASGG